MDTSYDQSRSNGEMVRSLFVLLILAGLGIGALASMEIRGRERRAGLAADNHQLQTQLAFLEAKRGEILGLLARPQTELVKLAGAKEWSGQAATVAWDPAQRLAIVLADRLPPAPSGTAYHLRANHGAPLGELDPLSPSTRVYAVPPNIDNPIRFEITLDPAGDRRGQVVFAPVGT